MLPNSVSGSIPHSGKQFENPLPRKLIRRINCNLQVAYDVLDMSSLKEPQA